MAIAPMVDRIGEIIISHGERGWEMDPDHPDACLCGVPNYFDCPEWGEVLGLVIERADDAEAAQR